MIKTTATYIQNHLPQILEQWHASMENHDDVRYFQSMNEQVILATKNDLVQLMITALEDGDSIFRKQLVDFSEKIARIGWPISFVLNLIDNFGQVVFEMMITDEVIQKEYSTEYVRIFTQWINPLRDEFVTVYARTWEKTLALQKSALQELSASLIPVLDKISVMPLVGTIDTERAKLIMENLLDGVVKQRAEVVLLDITGVPVVDTMVAHHIIQAADAVRLVGAKCMLVGIRPEIAQTIVTLGINLSDFTTASTLQRGVEQALAWMNRKIVRVDAE